MLRLNTNAKLIHVLSSGLSLPQHECMYKYDVQKNRMHDSASETSKTYRKRWTKQ